MKKVFLEISQNSQENNCARVSFLIKLQAPFDKDNISTENIAAASVLLMKLKIMKKKMSLNTV